jgi:hypothetical protein
LPVGAFGPDQAGDQRIDLIAPRTALAGDLIKDRTSLPTHRIVQMKKISTRARSSTET